MKTEEKKMEEKIYVIDNHEIKAKTLQEAKEKLYKTYKKEKEIRKIHFDVLMKLVREEMKELISWISNKLSNELPYYFYECDIDGAIFRRNGYTYASINLESHFDILEKDEKGIINEEWVKVLLEYDEEENAERYGEWGEDRFETIFQIYGLRKDFDFYLTWEDDYVKWYANRDDHIKKIKEMVNEVRDETLRLAKDYEIQTFNNVKKIAPGILKKLDEKLDEEIKKINSKKERINKIIKTGEEKYENKN